MGYMCNKDTLNQIVSIMSLSLKYLFIFTAMRCSTNWLKSPKYLIFINLLLTLQCMKEHGVWNFVFSSSATVYGLPNCLPISEDHPVGNGITNPYGRSKFFIEQIVQDLCKAEKV